MPFQIFELLSAWDVFSDLRLGQELTNQEEERLEPYYHIHVS